MTKNKNSYSNCGDKMNKNFISRNMCIFLSSISNLTYFYLFVNLISKFYEIKYRRRLQS